MGAVARADSLGWRPEARARIGGWAARPAQMRSDDEQRDFVPVFFLKEALSAVAGRGLDLARVLAEAEIPASLLTIDDGRMTAAQFGRFWNALARDLDDEFFCQDARGMPSGSYTLMCHAVLHAGTLERAIHRMLRFYGVLLDDFNAKLTVSDDVAEVRIDEDGPPRSAFAYATFLVQFLGVACWLVDRRIPLIAAEFRSPTPLEPQHFRRLIHDDLEFGRSVTIIRFEAAYLAMRPRRTEVQMKRFLKESPEVFLAQYRSRDSLAARIWQELRVTPPEAWPGFEELAAGLHTTPSTLRRRLEDEQASYQRIKDGVRRERAINRLRENIMSNAAIAEELGFGDPSTFYRAFRKWTGATPNAFRTPLRSLG